MSLGERLYELRKKKGLSQEEVAEQLNVTRQSVSKWETDESKPDFDKIIPICDLFEITSNELLTGEIIEKEESIKIEIKDNKKKRAIYISSAIFLYFIAVIWIVILATSYNMNEGIMVGGFLFICGIATAILIYQGIVLSTDNKEKKEKTEEEKKLDNIIEVIEILFTVIYLLISFLTNAWHLTWIIWLVYAIVKRIVVIIYNMRSDKNER